MLQGYLSTPPSHPAGNQDTARLQCSCYFKMRLLGRAKPDQATLTYSSSCLMPNGASRQDTHHHTHRYVPLALVTITIMPAGCQRLHTIYPACQHRTHPLQHISQPTPFTSSHVRGELMTSTPTFAAFLCRQPLNQTFGKATESHRNSPAVAAAGRYTRTVGVGTRHLQL